MGKKINRRQMLQKVGKFGLAAAGLELIAATPLLNTARHVSAAENYSTVVVASRGSIKKMTRKVIEKLGGIRRFVRKGARVVIKPNAAWARTPSRAANTHPQVIEALIDLCIVAVDAYATTLLGYKPSRIGHIVQAHRHGIGEMDLKHIKIVRM